MRLSSEHNALWHKYWQTRDRAVRDELFKLLMDECEDCIRVSISRAPKSYKDDARQAALIGLLGAIETYDPSGKSPASFKTYAQKRIRGAVIDMFRQLFGRDEARSNSRFRFFKNLLLFSQMEDADDRRPQWFTDRLVLSTDGDPALIAERKELFERAVREFKNKPRAYEGLMDWLRGCPTCVRDAAGKKRNTLGYHRFRQVLAEVHPCMLTGRWES